MRWTGFYGFLLAGFSASLLADEARYIWVPNSQEGTVSKLDAVTGAEVARYPSTTREAVIDVMGVGKGVLQPWGAVHRPEALALDFRGNAWVTNLAPGEQPSASKIMNHRPNCVDRNGNLQIDTSHEVNLTPGIQTSDPAEFPAESDECVVFTALVGVDDGRARALAIDRGGAAGDTGDAWIGMTNESAFYQLDGETGALLRRVPPVGPGGASPFAAAIDGDGHLWSTHGCCSAPRLWRIDTATGASLATFPFFPPNCAGSFGVAVGPAGKIWMGGFPCASAYRFDPSTTSWFEVQTPGQGGAGGLGIAIDRHGAAWLALSVSSGAPNRLSRIDTSLGVSTGVYDLTGQFPMGAAVDFAGDIWTLNNNSDDLSRVHLDPLTGLPAPHPTTGNVEDRFPVGAVGEALGDFSGLAMHVIVRPDPPGLIFADDFYSGGLSAWSSAAP